MSYIRNYINELNKKNRKALSVYLTAGYPDKKKFPDLAKAILDAGADMLEVGIPFSDPLADGPVIQASSKSALDAGITMKDVLKYAEDISHHSDKPVILMGYANPIKKYGTDKFIQDASKAGVKGLIVPDVPLEEYDSFFGTDSQSERSEGIDIILLTTPTSTKERIREIDSRSSGFVYCVSVTGTTGARDKFSDEVLSKIQNTRSIITKNKMLIGFGISKPEDVKIFSSYCDGVIVGSAVIKSLMNNPDMNPTLKLVATLSEACNID